MKKWRSAQLCSRQLGQSCGRGQPRRCRPRSQNPRYPKDSAVTLLSETWTVPTWNNYRLPASGLAAHETISLAGRLDRHGTEEESSKAPLFSSNAEVLSLIHIT